MNNTPKMQQSGQNQQAWWTREKRDSLGERIQKIQKINDPTTNADEVLTGSKVLLVVLLFFSGALGALSYFKNFSISFPVEFAIFLSLSLTFTIEWGKNKCATWAARIPFFQGWGHITRTPANTFIFAGLVLVAIATFTMSIYNSTKGGEQLALMLSQEKNNSPFQPNTTEIDKQITHTQGTVSAAPMVKWKGKQYYQDAKSVRAAQNSISSLQRQRESTIAQQRADWEANEAKKQGNSNFAANVVLASGGWVELLQILLILLRVACEKNLDGRQSSPSPTPRTNGNTIGFKNGQQAPEMQNATPTQRIGFNLDADGNVRRKPGITEDVLMSSRATNSVIPLSETPPTMSETGGYTTGVGADQTLRLLKLDLQREMANFRGKYDKASSVSARINRRIDEAGMIMEMPGFAPSRLIAVQVYDYMASRVFPSLNEKGWPYERERIFLSRLKAACEAAKGGVEV
jgi:hypothetical protein